MRQGSLDALADFARRLPAEAAGGVLKTYGRQLFTTYLLPMQVAGFLLLVAMIGVIVISKKTRDADESDAS